MNILFQCDQLKPLGQESCKELWRQSTILDVDAKDYLWQKDQAVKSVYVLLEGAVYFSEIDLEGNETVFYPRYPINLFGETEVILDHPTYKNYSTALSKSKIAVFDKGLLLEHLESNPGYMRWWLQQMTERVQAMKQLCMATTASSPEEMVIKTLIAGYQHGKSAGGDYTFPYTQDLFANMLGVSRRAVNKTLKDLASKGYIELQYGKIILHDTIFQLL